MPLYVDPKRAQAPAPVAAKPPPKVANKEDQKNLKFAPLAPQNIAAPAPLAVPKLENPQAANLQAMRSKFLDSRRGEIERSSRGASQEAQDMIQRRMSAVGQAGSGAALGLSMKASEGLEAQKQAAMGEVAGLEAQAAEGDFNRSFQSAEAGRQMQFNSDQAGRDLGMKAGMFNIENGNRMQELDMARKQLIFDRADTEFNKWLANEQLKQGPGGGGGK